MYPSPSFHPCISYMPLFAQFLPSFQNVLPIILSIHCPMPHPLLSTCGHLGIQLSYRASIFTNTCIPVITPVHYDWTAFPLQALPARNCSTYPTLPAFNPPLHLPFAIFFGSLPNSLQVGLGFLGSTGTSLQLLRYCTHGACAEQRTPPQTPPIFCSSMDQRAPAWTWVTPSSRDRTSRDVVATWDTGHEHSLLLPFPAFSCRSVPRLRRDKLTQSLPLAFFGLQPARHFTSFAPGAVAWWQAHSSPCRTTSPYPPPHSSLSADSLRRACRRRLRQTVSVRMHDSDIWTLAGSRA